MKEPAEIIINADDNTTNRNLVSHVLRREGFEVRDAATGGEALRLAAEGAALVVLDINLPDVNGYEVCRRLKSDPATASVLVLHLSAEYVRGEDRVAGLEGGADGYLTRPIDPPELVAAVRALLRLRRVEAEARRLASRWQATFDAINDGVCVVDTQGLVLQHNQALQHLVNRPGEAITGRPVGDWLEEAGEGALARTLRTHRREAVEQAVAGRRVRVTADPLFGEGGAVRGAVLILADLTEKLRAERAEAEVRRQASRVAALEQEVQALEALAGRPTTSVTAGLYAGAPLREASPGAFTELTGDFAAVLRLALDQREFKVSHPVSERLRVLGERLGFLQAGPRDVIAVYTAALRQTTAGAAVARASAYVEEGRLMALEVMGHLAAYYRLRALGVRGADGGGGAPGGAAP